MAPLTVLTLLVSLAAARGAPSAEEQRLFAEGMAAWNAGDARAAERAWTKGYGVGHDPAFLVRVGEAEERAGAPAEAAETYRRYLREAPDASDRADVEQRLARLAPPPASAAPAPAPTASSGEAPHEFGAATEPSAAATRAVVGDAEPPPRSAGDGGSGWNRLNVTAMSAAAASVLLLGTAAFFGAEAASKEGDVNRLQSFRDQTTGAPVPYSTVARQYDSALADGRRDAHDARLALLGAAGAAAVSIVFFVLDARGPQDAAVAAVAFSPAPSGGSVNAAWRF